MSHDAPSALTKISRGVEDLVVAAPPPHAVERKKAKHEASTRVGRGLGTGFKILGGLTVGIPLTIGAIEASPTVYHHVRSALGIEHLPKVKAKVTITKDGSPSTSEALKNAGTTPKTSVAKAAGTCAIGKANVLISAGDTMLRLEDKLIPETAGTHQAAIDQCFEQLNGGRKPTSYHPGEHANLPTLKP